MNAAAAERARHAVLAYLYARDTLSFSASAIAQDLARSHSLSEDQVQSALQFLEGAALVKTETDALGSTKYWQITASGILHYERH